MVGRLKTAPRGLAVGAAVILCGVAALPRPAAATYAETFSPGTAVGSGMATFDYQGSYVSALPTPLAAPLLGPTFGLTAILPEAVQTQVPVAVQTYPGPATGVAISGISGSYTNGGNTYAFANATLDMLEASRVLGDPATTQDWTESSLYVTSLLTPGDSFFVALFPDTFLFTITPSGSGSLLTFTPGTFADLQPGLADYQAVADPQATIGIGGSGSLRLGAPVPEPGSFALFSVGLAALGLKRRRRRV
jgi:hypothetical protein